MPAFLASPARAGETSLLVNGWADHLAPAGGAHYNERNWGAGLQYDFTAPGRQWIPFLNVSEFLDSNHNPSWYAGGGIVRRFSFGEGDAFHADIGAIGFLMHREDFRHGHLFPGVLPVASLGGRYLSVNMTYIPKVDPKMVPLYFFQIKITFQNDQ